MKNRNQDSGMGISTRFTGITAAAYASLVVLLSLSIVLIVLPRFDALERGLHEESVQRVEEVASSLLSRLQGKVREWGFWDDAHAFVLSNDGDEVDQKFRSSNFTPASVEMLGAESARFYRMDGSVRAAQNKPGVTSEVDAFDAALTRDRVNALLAKLIAKKNQGGPDPKLGEVLLLNTASGPMSIAFSLVSNTAGTADPVGLLVFVKHIKADFIDDLSRLTKLNTSFESAPLEGLVESRDVTMLAGENLLGGAVVVRGSQRSWLAENGENSDTAGRFFLKDLDGNPLATVFFPLARDINDIGVRATQILVAGVVALLALCAFYLHASLARLVVRPIVFLAHEVRAIRDRGAKAGIETSAARVSVPAQRGEVTLLAGDINEMLVKIEERNKALNDISNNVTVGVVISDAQGHVLPGHTKHTLKLLDPHAKVRSLEGHKLSGLLFPDSRRGQENFDALYEQVFEDLVPEDITLSMLPERTSLDGRILSLKGSGLRDNASALAGVLWTIVDITEQVQAEETNRLNASLLRILKRTEPFRAFVEASRASFAALGKIFAAPSQSVEDEREARRTLHTLKGNFGVFGLSELSTATHQVEEARTLTSLSIEPLLAKFEEGIESIQRIVGVSVVAEGSREVNVPHDELASTLSRCARATSPEEARAMVVKCLERALQPSFAQYIEPLSESTKAIAQRYGKKIQVHVEGGDTKAPTHIISKIADALTHALRNSVHHSLESTAARVALQKSEQGEIRVNFSVQEFPLGAENLQVMIDDDGRGFDIELIRAKAIKQNLVTAERARNLSEDEIIAQTFLDGFSTAAQVNDIAGRGVGMSAIQQIVEELGGTVIAQNRPGAPGSRLHITLPLWRAVAQGGAA